jgi:diacylglycerol kinase family enzyme
MKNQSVHVIATTMSGSISDWSKVPRILPTFKKFGMNNIVLHSADSHLEARARCREAIDQGARTVISAGGSGTFNSVLEGCCDSGVPLGDIQLGFLRKGSADLIGKTLGMPDQLDLAVQTFVDSIEGNHTTPCDVILASSIDEETEPHHFVGYGGAEIFGRIPHYTENRFIKYYKGVLSQIFGDLGPFKIGTSLATIDKVVTRMRRPGLDWSIRVDSKEVSAGRFQALLVVNGFLGPDLPFSTDLLGSGRFHLFAIRDQGMLRIPSQAIKAFSGKIIEDPARYGMEHYCVRDRLELIPDTEDRFPINVDGSTMLCRRGVRFQIVDSVRLFTSSGTIQDKKSKT